MKSGVDYNNLVNLATENIGDPSISILLSLFILLSIAFLILSIYCDFHKVCWNVSKDVFKDHWENNKVKVCAVIACVVIFSIFLFINFYQHVSNGKYMFS
uniref:Uncharacterized protein n=1 Tax=Aliivibrio wodanis TaxID=80852 RepID=A0A5Q4ZYM6_9GAMM|nr:hypothetical protein AW0309160_04449 [Aliivibrio wodanis]